MCFLLWTLGISILEQQKAGPETLITTAPNSWRNNPVGGSTQATTWDGYFRSGVADTFSELAALIRQLLQFFLLHIA